MTMEARRIQLGYFIQSDEDNFPINSPHGKFPNPSPLYDLFLSGIPPPPRRGGNVAVSSMGWLIPGFFRPEETISSSFFRKKPTFF